MPHRKRQRKQWPCSKTFRQAAQGGAFTMTLTVPDGLSSPGIGIIFLFIFLWFFFVYPDSVSKGEADSEKAAAD